MSATAALLEVLEARGRVFPALDVDWVAPNGYAIESARYAGGDLALPDRFARGRAVAGGFRDFEYGPGARPGSLESIRASVVLADTSGELAAFLERYQPRRSPATSYQAALDLQPGDWTVLLRGLVVDWKPTFGRVELILQSDDRPLRAPVPKATINAPEWGTAADPAVYGNAFPLALGIHDSYALSGGGMLVAVNLCYDAVLGYIWVCSLNLLKSVFRVCINGVLTVGSYTIVKGVFGGVEMTQIVFAAGFQPEKDATVTFDCEGPDADGRAVGAPLVNAVAQLRAILASYGYADLRIGPYLADTYILHQPTFDAAEALFSKHDSESAISLGGAKDAMTGQAIIESFLRAHKYMRAWWTPAGTIAMAAIDAVDEDPPSDWLDASFAAEPVPPGTPDGSETYGAVSMSYLYSHADQKFYSKLLAVDSSALDDRSIDPVDNTWGPGRFSRP